MNRKVIFYGDSNTYGYDPAASMFGSRYSYELRWTSIVAEELNDRFEICPEGMNGRKLPDPSCDQTYLMELIRLAGKDGILCTMLGTNDLLQTMPPDASGPVRMMKQYLLFLKKHLDPSQIMVIAPPAIGPEEMRDPLFRRYHEESLKMNDGFRKLAAENGVMFADACGWGIGLSYDMIHFSEKGHRTFAREMIKCLTANGAG